MTALYRKYRPLDFDEVVGQEAVVRTLRNAIERDLVRQAYLFAGPRGTGKTSLARIVAKSLNCEQRADADPVPGVHVLPHDRRTAPRSTWSRWTPPRSAGSTTSGRSASGSILQPVQGRYKVYILDEAHQLTDAAFNALLKLIEEPPPHLVFIFCTTELAKMIADRPLALPDVPVRSARGSPELSAAPATRRRRRGDRRRPTPRSR